jgi:hypothetical protein
VCDGTYDFLNPDYDVSPHLNNAAGNVPAYLNQAIIEDNARYIDKEMVSSGKAYVRHFRDGRALPFNADITGMVFYNSVFGDDFVRNRQRLFNLFDQMFEALRHGYRFFLPDWIGYPNHTPFMKIDYRKYLPASEIVEISVWNLDVHVVQQKATIIRAVELGRFGRGA